MQSITGLHVHDAAAFSASARRRCSQELKTQQSLFSRCLLTPHPPLGVRYCLAIQKSNVELFQISQSGFPFSSIPSDANKALRDPCKSGRSCLQRDQSQPSGCKAPQDCFARWWLCFPTADGHGHGHEVQSTRRLFSRLHSPP